MTSYFNPVGYKRRLQNYRAFRKHLSVPLITVELTCRTDFELRGTDADILIQLRGPDVMFQKERLLNVALQALPLGCEAVALLDCDVIFHDPDWPSQTLRALERHSLVHLYERLRELRPEAPPWGAADEEAFAIRRSWAAERLRGSLPEDCFLKDHRAEGISGGMAWAARPELFHEIGLYDACVVGGGMRALLGGAIGRPQDAVEFMRYPTQWARHYIAWAEQFHQRAKGSIGALTGALDHLWHGDLANRRYAPRHVGFAEFDFDPVRDIGRDSSGVYRWTSNKPAMHQYVRDYFDARKEDG